MNDIMKNPMLKAKALLYIKKHKHLLDSIEEDENVEKERECISPTLKALKRADQMTRREKLEMF